MLTHSPLLPFASVILLIAAALLTALAPGSAWGQGGGIANSIGISIGISANAANNQNAANVANANNAAQQSRQNNSGSEEMEEEMEYSDDVDDDGSGGGGDYDMEYETEDGYDDGTGYGGRRGGNRSGRGSSPIDDDRLAMLSGVVAGSMAEFFNRPLPESAHSFKPTLYEQAALALHQGDQRRALALFHAHLVAERANASAGLSSVRYSPMLRRPAWAVRLAVSINAKVPPDLADDPQPIREGDQAATTSRRRPGARSVAGSQYSSDEDYSDDLEPPSDSVDDYDETSEDFYSDEPKSAQPKQEIVPTTPGGADTLMAEETLDRHLGLVADVVKAELTQRISAGKFGDALAELAPHGQELAAKAMASTAPAVSRAADSAAMWIPGVDFLGTGIPAEVLEKARANEVDVLFHCEVLVKETRGGDPQYSLRCRVINVATGETLGASKLIDKRDLLLAARRSSNKAVVEEMLQPAWDAIDSKAVLQPMPELAPQHAISRVDSLLASQQPTRMRNLAEIVMFQQRGLIDEDQLEQAIFFAAGEDGLRLLFAEQEQRGELAASLVAKELGED